MDDRDQRIEFLRADLEASGETIAELRRRRRGAMEIVEAIDARLRELDPGAPEVVRTV